MLPIVNRPSSIVNSSRYLFFCGKGGVGKTTAAAAAALYLLEQARSDEQILLFSTDPAHSLSDSLETKIGDRIVEVASHGKAKLYARELDAGAALEKFRTQHGATLKEIVDRGTLLDEADINELFDLSLPGLDEVMALFELSQHAGADEYTRIVVDTAPSGHTARFLRLPEVFTHWISALDRMTAKHRYMVAQLTRGRQVRHDPVDLLLRELAEQVQRVNTLLHDRNQTAFALVTTPQVMSVEETVRYFKFLTAEGMPVTELVINRVESGRRACRYCRTRVSAQKPVLRRLELEFAGLRQRLVPQLAEEVRGLEALRQFAQLAWKAPGLTDAEKKLHAEVSPISALPRPAPARVKAATAGFRIEPRRLLIFGGKGGVGKTTAAAASGLALAENDRGSRVLVLSTDPAHSLSDSFAQAIGVVKKRVARRQNLDAMEIEPAARFDELKNRYRQWTEELFESLRGDSSWTIQFEREAMEELVALAPPGIDEIVALSAIIDLLDDGKYTTIVVDTAPTGHLIRFLELPDVALSWVRAFIKLLLKYKNVVQYSGIAEELIALSKSIKRIVALLTDGTECEFVGVAIAERMSLEETVRLSESLRKLKVPMRRLIVNNVIPDEAAVNCSFCAVRRRAQERVIQDFRQRLKGLVTLFFSPQQPYEIRGPERLREHSVSWKQLAAVDQNAR